MALIDILLAGFDRETATTRRLLELVPDAAFDWKPHDRSMTLGGLAAHLVNLPAWIGNVMNHAWFDLAESLDEAKSPAANTAELLSRFDENVRAARALLVNRIDDELNEPWTLKRGKQDLFTLPRIGILRYFVLNHLIHHRGQLSIYLRLHDVPIPAIYEPSTDEGPL